MKQSLRALVGVTAAVATFAFAAGPAQAASKEEGKCHSTIAKNITKYQGTLFKTVTGCHKSRSGGKLALSTDCNDVDEADTKAKLGTARTKTRDGILKACNLSSPALTAAVLALYPRCPSPVADSDDTGTSGIDDFTELANCLMDLSDAYVSRIAWEAMGSPAAILDKKTNGKCQGAIGKAISKAAGTAGKERSKCQNTLEKTQPVGYASSCGTGDASGKITPAMVAIDTAIATSCNLSAASLRAIGACGETVAQLQECIRDRAVEPTSNGLVAAAYELPGNCAATADVIVNAGIGSRRTNTRLDTGFTGLAHNVDVTDGFLGGVKLTNCDADCENCDIELDPYNGYCRCANDPTVTCDERGVADVNSCGATSKCVGGTNEGATCTMSTDCNSNVCGDNTCVCMFGPPLPLSSGGTPVCVVNVFDADFDGQTGAVGEYDVLTYTRAVVHTGLNQVRPCPTCVAGTCNGGVRNGKTGCSVDATSLDFGNVSFDCPPNPGAGIGALGLGLTFTDGEQSVTASITGAQCEAGTCHCSQCSGDASVGCSSDADCALVGAGTCTNSSEPSKQNACTSVASCSDTGGNNGECGGDVDQFCDGLLKANGEGFLTCVNDANCTTLNSLCPGGNCGTCTNFRDRRCFLPTVQVDGTPGIFGSEGVSLFCSAATASTSVNDSGGLPGLGRVKLDFDFDLWCDDNHTVQFQLPGGSNCP